MYTESFKRNFSWGMLSLEFAFWTVKDPPAPLSSVSKWYGRSSQDLLEE
jgi:hypothetical protein